ncbi:MAG TPA: ABC transporter permease [bacterium]|nr:ABC transporter permease [bacterium]HPQ66251.1 ABC transporter permease [bacterium]
MNAGAFGILWRRRHLLGALAKRDLLGRYRGSALGLLWALAEPLALLGIYTLVFGVMIGLGRENGIGSYALSVFCAILIWLAFSEAVNRSTTVIWENPSLVKKVIFPHEVLPLKVVIAGIANQLPGFCILLAAVAAFQGTAHWSWAWIPLLLLPLFLCTAGVAFFVAGLGPVIRDIRQFASLATLCWMFLTPIFYPESVFRGRWALWLLLNPLAALIHNFRAAILGGKAPDWGMFVYTLALGLLLYRAGFAFFKKAERVFADLV